MRVTSKISNYDLTVRTVNSVYGKQNTAFKLDEVKVPIFIADANSMNIENESGYVKTGFSPDLTKYSITETVSGELEVLNIDGTPTGSKTQRTETRLLTYQDALPPDELEDLVLFSFEAEGAIVGDGILQVQKPNDRLGDFTVERNSPATYVDINGIIQTAPANYARIDYTNGVAELLCEPQSTNLIPWSEDFDQWAKFRSLVVSNNTISPDGTINADKIKSDTTLANSHYDRYEYKIADSIDLAYSIFVKKAEYSKYLLQIRQNNGAVSNIIFDMDTLMFDEQSANIDGIYELYDNGWINLIFYFSSGVGINNFRVENWLHDGTSTVFDGDGVSGYYIWGAQLEQLPYDTSYIKTEGSTVTRLGDIIKDGANANVINSEEGTLFVEMSTFTYNGEIRYLSLIDSYSWDDRVEITYVGDDSIRVKFLIDSEPKEIVTSGIAIKDTLKTASLWGGNIIKAYINGSQVGTDTTIGNMLVGKLKILTLTNNVGDVIFYGRIRQIKIYNDALTDAELKYITE